MRVAGSEAEGAWHRPTRERLGSPQDPRRRGLEGGDCRDYRCTDAEVRACAGASVGRGARRSCAQEEEALETRGTAQARVGVAVGGGGDSGSAEPQTAVTGRRVLVGREVLVYLAKQGQLDVDVFNLLGLWDRQGTDSVCSTTSTVMSPAEMPCLAFIARCTMGSRPPAVRQSELFQRSPTSLVTRAVGYLQVWSSALFSFR